MSNIALLIAGGSGNRMHQDIPKQFITVNERPVIVYTLEAFEKHPEIDAIAVVCIEGWENVLWAYAKQFNISKLQYIVPGGKNGQDSIRNGVYELESILRRMILSSSTTPSGPWSPRRSSPTISASPGNTGTRSRSSRARKR